MGAREKLLENERFKEVDPKTERMFRFHAAKGWMGPWERLKDGRILVGPGAQLVQGAPTGFPDTAGWKTITVTPDMIGKKLAVFVGEELKATGDLSPEQRAFGKILKAMGGIFRVKRADD
jgi:hypothetical protein